MVRDGAGFDNLNLDACTKAGVVAMNAPRQNANALLAAVCQIVDYFEKSEARFQLNLFVQGKMLQEVDLVAEAG